ncbi:type I DNA topoisomerase [Lewinella sp. 4G2]|uniref:type I DNA topoisomerase n=1 Tax=Lewinella sp. 4G2 TaxID=1803372 RepID=UPI0007B4AA18|nr:type I DNA topoisomerase [Lewinella sp. 4G2]OAV44728.1 DNA topoisomerase I [Lewinella sp. 4G2]
MAKNLLIVESPAKAKTIEKILGKDFTVQSSFGHIRDLDKGDGAVDIARGFKPKYVVSPDKRKQVQKLKTAMNKADTVWLATDEDREGEAISWHLCEVLKLPVDTTKRIVFREITPPAIKAAISNPRLVDINLVNAQQARRILDRLVGYELSGVLWKKVKFGLSAGRVQSVTVKLVVEREREIMDFTAEPFFRVNAIFDVRNEQGRTVKLKAESPTRYNDREGAEKFLSQCAGADFSIKNIDVKPTKRRPAAPFTTSTLQQEASRKLYMNPENTMRAAQRLYEAGLITYMRTDSISLSETAMTAIEKEIKSAFGNNYSQPRRHKSKKKDAQEAHEAIRPTYIDRHTVNVGDRYEQRLYELIWKRTIASQMSDAQLEKTTVEIGVSTVPDAKLKAQGEVLKFDGFLKVYLEGQDDDDDDKDDSGILPPLSVGQPLPLAEMTATQRFTRPPSRYTQASLIKKLEELGIGRPSTYAPTVSKIMDPKRGYVTSETREGTERKYEVMTLKNGTVSSETKTEMTGAVKNRLFASDMGMAISDFLDQNFEEVMNYDFTAEVEEKFDRIAEGRVTWTQMLSDFYHPFHEKVEDTTENAERVSGERILGQHPETGRTVLVRLSRNGPVIQLGSPDELLPDEKPRYANLPLGMSMEQIDLETALPLFTLPKVLGEIDGQETAVGIGRYGPYVRWGETFVSLEKGEDPHSVDLNRAKELVAAKKKADAPVMTFQELPVQRGSGRFGPFLKWNGMFINIPKRYNPDNLSKDDMVELIQAKIEKEANRYIQRFPEEKIDVEQGRWGPFIRFKKKSIKIPKNKKGERMTREEAAELPLEKIKKLITAEMPTAFKTKKKAAPKKKAPAKKKAAPKK